MPSPTPMPSRVSFQLAPHAYRGGQVVEIMVDGAVCAALYARPGAEVMLASVHVADAREAQPTDITMQHDDGAASFPQVPAWRFRFEPRPYHLGPNGEIVRE